MKLLRTRSAMARIRATVAVLMFGACAAASAQSDPLPSWNDGAAKKAIVEFVQTTTTQGSPNYVPPPERIATFDQDGTLWVEHPIYAQVMYCLDRVPALVKAKPELAKVEPFKTVLSGNREAIAKLPEPELLKIVAATLTGMSVEDFQAEVKKWLAEARDPRWKRPYTELTYLPMQELLKYLRSNGFKTYIVTGGGQDFVRMYSEAVYGIPPEQVVGTAGGTQYGYDKSGRPFLTKEPRLLLNDDKAGKPEGIHLMIGRRPLVAFGNSDGDQQMLEYTKAGGGVRLALLLLHDDAKREYAYGPATGLTATKVGAFTQGLHDQARKQGWVVVSVKNDWRRVFAFD
jgi:phosphoglycolate phosphatase-like HAD superfamily hydrolase